MRGGVSAGPSGQIHISAAHVAVAVVTACRLRGVDPATVFERGQENRQARVLAAAGLSARLGVRKTAVAPLLKVFPQEVAPSMLAKAGVTTDGLLAIAEALQAAGLTADDAARERFVAPWVPEVGVPEAEGPPPEAPSPEKPQPAEAACPQPPAASAEPAHKPGPDGEVRSGQPGRGPVRGDVAAASGTVRGSIVAAPRAPAATDDAGAGPSSFKRRTVGLASAASRARARQGEDRQEIARHARTAVARLKAVTDRIAGWAGHFLEAGWDRVEVAELFDVCPDALLNALDPA